MDTADFLLVRDTFRTFAGRAAAATSADLTHDARAATQRALDELGLGELRTTAPPYATTQECALLAEDHGSRPLPTSFLGTVLLAPELARLARADVAGRPTVALARDLAFPTDTAPAAVAWDCEGADSALAVTPDGDVVRYDIGEGAPGADLMRAIRRTDGGPVGVGHLDAEALDRWHAYALTIVAAELTGAARTFVGLAVDYATTRVQYGRPVGSFQAVQHLLADATVHVEACTSAVRYAAWAADHEPPGPALTAARVAKAETGDCALEAAYAAAQVFGGIAQTWEHVAHLYLRKIRVGADVLATTTHLFTVLADGVGR